MAARANNTVSNLDPHKVPWFADCAPSLLTNRTIRRHLNAYSQHTWPEVIKLTLIYGVLGLEQQFPGGTLSILQLRQLVEKGGAQLVVERNLPGLQRQILNLQTNLDAVFDRLAVEPPPPDAGDIVTATRQLTNTGMPPQQQQQPILPVQQVLRNQHQQQQQVQQVPVRATVPSGRPASALNPGPVAPKPPDNWRQGERTGFPSPPRSRDNPLRRSADNQGATNPIYPDWWLAAGPFEPPAPKVVPQKVPRKQPRLAYSVQQQPEASGAAADDLVTAEYLIVPGSGYGQGEPEPVVSGSGPPVMLTSITADNIQTGPLAAVAQQQSAAAAGGGGGVRGAAAGRGPRRPQAAQSKIKEAVAASRQKAAAQQQRRQQLLASAVAAGSSLFGAAGDGAPQQQQQQQPARRSSAAAEAVAACAPAAAAKQFLTNPWTSCFLQPSGVRADVVGYTQLPAADIGADDEGRLGALAGGELGLGELQQPRAPAAYAVLKRVVAAGDTSSAAGGDTMSQSRAQMESELAAATAAAAAEIREIEAQQEQVDEGQSADAGRSTVSKASAGRTRAAQASSSRGVFADITSALNSQSFNSAAAAAAAGMQHELDGADDWRNLPLVGEQAELQADLFYQQQQQQHQQRQPEAWACDFGHLEDVQAPPSKRSARPRGVSGKPHKKWSETWVGDFGHLQEFPRFARETAFQHGAAADAAASDTAGSPKPSSKLFMSPADLQALVAAADRLGHTQQRGTDLHGSPGAAVNSRSVAAYASAAAAAAGEGGSVSNDADGGAGAGSSSRAAVGLDESASANSLAARFAELLSRWDGQAADSASQLPAGVAARASVSHAAAGKAAGAAYSAAVGAANEGAVNGAAGDAGGAVNIAASSSSGSYNTAGSDVEAPAGDSQQQRLRAEAALVGASADTAALLQDLQQAVSELSTAVDSDADSAVGDLAGALSAATGVKGVAAAEVVRASADLLPAEGHLEGMQEASQMLQQALSRHDALMQLIASLGGAPGSGSDALLSSAASGSELTM